MAWTFMNTAQNVTPDTGETPIAPLGGGVGAATKDEELFGAQNSPYNLVAW